MSTARQGHPRSSPHATRSERALATRRRITEAAARMFADPGYTATAMDRVAQAAGVAVQTVYYTFGTKGALLCAAMDYASAGSHDADPVMRRAWVSAVLSAPSGGRALALAVEDGVDIYVRSAPLWPAMQTASSDDAVASFWAGVASGRRAGMGRIVEHLAAEGWLRTGLDAARAADIFYALHSHDSFTSLVTEAGWPVPRYKRWLHGILADQLLAPDAQSESDREGLSYDSPEE